MRSKGQFSAPGPANRKMLRLQRFRALVDRSFRAHKSVAFYAGELGITPTQLNRVCREVPGKSALGARFRVIGQGL